MLLSSYFVMNISILINDILLKHESTISRSYHITYYILYNYAKYFKVKLVENKILRTSCTIYPEII